MKTEVLKPHSLTDSEFAEMRRATRQNYPRYVFWRFELIWGPLGIFLGAFLYQLFRAGGQPIAALEATIRSGVFIGFAFFTLFVVIRRSIEWRGKRATVKTLGL